MVQTSGIRKRTAFSRWLRTGMVPSALGPDGLELKSIHGMIRRTAGLHLQARGAVMDRPKPIRRAPETIVRVLGAVAPQAQGIIIHRGPQNRQRLKRPAPDRSRATTRNR